MEARPPRDLGPLKGSRRPPRSKGIERPVMALPAALFGLLGVLLLFVGAWMLLGRAIDRGPRAGVEMLALVALMAIWTLGLAAHFGRRAARAMRSARSWRDAEAAGRPWDAEPEWRAAECRPVVSFHFWSALGSRIPHVGAVVYLAAVLPEWRLWIVAGGVPFVAATLPLRAIQRALQARRWGPMSLHLAEVPVAPGGTLRAELACREPELAGDAMVFRLVCSREVKLRRSSLRSDDQELELLVPRGRWRTVPGGEVRVPVEIEIPDDLPGWGLDPATRQQIYWQLEAWGGDVRGVDFGALFDVPVFRASRA
jgi:hypothetical protein